MINVSHDGDNWRSGYHQGFILVFCYESHSQCTIFVVVLIIIEIFVLIFIIVISGNDLTKTFNNSFTCRRIKVLSNRCHNTAIGHQELDDTNWFLIDKFSKGTNGDRSLWQPDGSTFLGGFGPGLLFGSSVPFSKSSTVRPSSLASPRIVDTQRRLTTIRTISVLWGCSTGSRLSLSSIVSTETTISAATWPAAAASRSKFVAGGSVLSSAR
mmetsp:Transcript_7170/g.14650  ORF Transcript_7170/g.14650 Transcript_7170/m.14650 type:complete len:212 (+) Transcript_7170:1516-2151(+)